MNDRQGPKSKPHRPPRLSLLSSGVRPFYFVTFNTHRRVPTLAQNDIHATFCRFCGQARLFGVTVGRYVLMPDHVHLFVVLPPRRVGDHALGTITQILSGQNAAESRSRSAALAGGLLRSCPAFRRKLRAEMGICPAESGPAGCGHRRNGRTKAKWM